MSIYVHHRGEGSLTVNLARWSIRQFADGARHFVGFCLESYDGRVSTKIIELDVENRTAKTESGRTYTLVGPAGRDRDGEYVWGRVWRAMGGGQEWTDVSEEVFPGSGRDATK